MDNNAMSTFGLGNLLLLLIFSHSSCGKSRSLTNETSSSGTSQSVRTTKVLVHVSEKKVENFSGNIITHHQHSPATSQLFPVVHFSRH